MSVLNQDKGDDNMSLYWEVVHERIPKENHLRYIYKFDKLTELDQRVLSQLYYMYFIDLNKEFTIFKKLYLLNIAKQKNQIFDLLIFFFQNTMYEEWIRKNQLYLT